MSRRNSRLVAEEEANIEAEKRRHAQAAAWAKRTGNAPPTPQPKAISSPSKDVLIAHIPEGCLSGKVYKLPVDGGFVEFSVPEENSEQWLHGRERCVELAVPPPVRKEEAESTLKPTPEAKEEEYALNLRDNCSSILVEHNAEYTRRQKEGTLSTSIEDGLENASFAQAPYVKSSPAKIFRSSSL